MNDYRNFCEYTVKPAPSRNVKFAAAALLLFYTILTLGYIFFFYIILRAWQMLILLPFIMYALINLTWRFVRVEFEYSIEAGVLRIAKIYDGRSRKVKFSGEIRDFLLIAPISGKTASLKAPDIVSVHDFSRAQTGAASAGNISADEAENDSQPWFAVLPERKSGKKQALLFETNPEMRRILHLCNPSAYIDR